jgi:hypothetical protein
MSIVTVLFSPVLLLFNQLWCPPLRLQHFLYYVWCYKYSCLL